MVEVVFGSWLHRSGVFIFILPFCLIKHAGKIQSHMPGIPSCDSTANEKKFYLQVAKEQSDLCQIFSAGISFSAVKLTQLFRLESFYK